MNNIVRAWKDAAYRQSLSAQEQAILPANPAGEIELTDVELEAVFGATGERERAGKEDITKIDQAASAPATTDNGNSNSGLLSGLHLLDGNNVAVGILASQPLTITCSGKAENEAKTDEW